MSFLDAPGPRWFTIPAHRPFVEDLAAGLLSALAPFGPEALSYALADEAELAGIAGAFERWAADPDGIFVVPHVEVRAVR